MFLFPSMTVCVPITLIHRYMLLLLMKWSFLFVVAHQNSEHGKMDIAAAPDPAIQSDTDAAIAAAMAATIDEAGPIDENLFADEDLDELDEDLEKLDL